MARARWLRRISSSPRCTSSPTAAPDPQQLYPGTITLTFPTHTTTAVIAGDLYDRRADWALLRCEIPPPGVRPIPIGEDGADANDWETFGFPDANPRDGMAQLGSIANVHGSLEGTVAYQLFSREAAAGSGAPVKGFRARRCWSAVHSSACFGSR